MSNVCPSPCSAIVTKCREVANILGNAEALDLTVMREFLKGLNLNDVRGSLRLFATHPPPLLVTVTLI